MRGPQGGPKDASDYGEEIEVPLKIEIPSAGARGGER